MQMVVRILFIWDYIKKMGKNAVGILIEKHKAK
jgi:hypothetical protein